jgi:uncharacterized protein (TIGR03086 family)
MAPLDLEPAARRLATLVGGMSEADLGGPTPCRDTTVGALLDHIDGLSQVFTATATKSGGDLVERAPSADAAHLAADWRTRIPEQLTALAAAWRRPEAWTGMTKAGGLELPGDVAGLVALDELVIHGWDVARATGQPFDCDPALLEALHGFVIQSSEPGQEAQREGLFGPVVAVPDDAPLLDRVIGLTGRDPAWSPA